ncbi:gem-associated protein 6 isoform X2 [Aquarana catesbeiana]|uniref:gem-associated protein 6 isoform X2 n=1 Tax=Aquarana catesbeiana TaxID=8400 RepID=UPI003CC9B4C8
MQKEKQNMTNWLDKSLLEWQSYVNKEVKVTADEKYEYQGWVVTVDPVSASVVLANFEEAQKTLVRVVMGHAIQNVEAINEADDIIKKRLSNMFSLYETSLHSSEDLETRKQSLKSWLEQNNIPVTVQGDSLSTLRVAGVLSIDPPYGPDNCSSTNEIILSRIQGLLQGYLTSQ